MNDTDRINLLEQLCKERTFGCDAPVRLDLNCAGWMIINERRSVSGFPTLRVAIDACVESTICPVCKGKVHALPSPHPGHGAGWWTCKECDACWIEGRRK